MRSRWLMALLGVPVVLALVLALAPAPVLAGVDEAEAKITEGYVDAVYYNMDGSISWIKVNGVKVVFTADTDVDTDDGDVVKGAVVDVEGTLVEFTFTDAEGMTRMMGKIVADEVTVKVLGEGDVAEGTIDIAGGTITKVSLMADGTGWIKVNGLKVIITADTDVNGDLVVGAEVTVEGPINMGKVTADKVSAAAVEVEEEEMEEAG